jgi:hypothetical protein
MITEDWGNREQRARNVRRACCLVFCLTTGIAAAPMRSGFAVPQDAPAAAGLSREQKWREDLRFLAKELPLRHKDLFRHLDRADFERQVRELDAAIPAMTDTEVTVGMMRLAASVRDGHTGVQWQPRRLFPLGLRWFDDELYLLAGPPSVRAYLGMRLVQIGDTDVKRALSAVRDIIPHENESWLLAQSPAYLTYPEVLHALKILPDAEKGRFVFEAKEGRRFTVELTPTARVERDDLVVAIDPEKPDAPLWMRKAEQNYWHEYLPESETLYVKYNRCAETADLPFEQFNRTVWAAADAHPVERLVVDLRTNTGGSSAIFRPFLNELRRRPRFRESGRLFAVIGRRTFSSGYLNALELRKAGAVLVGEPTGQKPNHFGEVRTFTLPHSGLTVRYSTKYFQTIADADPPSLLPDVPVSVTAAEYLAGIDPVLRAITAYPAKASP